jgi:hypothetical protein
MVTNFATKGYKPLLLPFLKLVTSLINLQWHPLSCILNINHQRLLTIPLIQLSLHLLSPATTELHAHCLKSQIQTLSNNELL